MSQDHESNSAMLELRDKQEKLWMVWNDFGLDAEESKAAIAEYEKNLAAADPNWPAWATDPEQYNLYSDVFKEDNGFRPRWFVTAADVKTWLDSRRSAA